MLLANFTGLGEEIEIENELWMYDYGQKLQITGLPLPEAFEVHFSWKDLEKAKVQIGTTVDGVSTVAIPDAALTQKSAVKAYIYLSTPEEGETTNLITMYISRRIQPEGFETPEATDLFHHTLAAVAEYQRQAETARDEAETSKKESESWAHGHVDFPSQDNDNAKYYAEHAGKILEEVSGRTDLAKKDIDAYVKQKEKDLRGDTGNVYFAAFKVVGGRLKMYSDPSVDKVRFCRKGSRLTYRLQI